MARHVVCPSSNRRGERHVRAGEAIHAGGPEPAPIAHQGHGALAAAAATAPPKVAPACLAQRPPVSGAIIGYAPAPQAVLAPTAWGMAMRAPVMMVAAAPARPMVMASSGAGTPGGNVSKRMGRSGTGVFLPWTVGPKRYNKHLPPRIQKRRFSAMMSPIEAQG
ncbi:hypothetical protein BS78_K174300 [Paspalum vaginatum]|uniref:Uncharacterized protein n=1 Tax=Paspalum vaginatum TaxID=158149 RepID=A0A9W7XB41_9POAL|nr:hypothetical protein BS78_K174300 [Paspalum vaginatum]